jgi:threonylcarbamoyladenosine tRNA methylthiotransferase MtaB
VRSFHIQNFGCRATQADGAALEGLLQARGLKPRTAAEAELVVLNTCTVTAAADEDLKKSVNRLRRENPAARILVTGCYAQRAPGEIAALDGVTWVVGNSHKTQIADIVLGAEYHSQIHVGEIGAQDEFLAAPVTEALGGRTRPNLKIQEGCSNVCSFCVIPSVRGKSRSMALGEVISQVRGLAANYREVVLTGINLGRWGRERGFDSGRGSLRLAGLLRILLNETEVELLRLSSVEPMDLSDELLALMAAEPRIAKHVHAPLQSGSDAVLKRMKRKYRTRHYEDRLLRARALMPDAAFGADVMTGFPGETEAEFAETLAFVDSLPFTYLHVFTYSERPGTAAAGHAQVPWQLRKERTRRLRELGAAMNLRFRNRMLGRPLRAVTLDNGTALTENYLQVELAQPRPANEWVTVTAGALTAQGLREATPFVICA